MNKPWLDEAVAPNGESVQANFKSWFDGSVVVDDAGDPMVLYRGQRRAPRDDGFATRNGRATPSFSHDPHVANVYSLQLGTYEYGLGSTVVPVFCAMKNPLDLRAYGEQITLDELNLAIRNFNIEEEEIEDGVGYFDLAEAIRGFDSVIEKTNARWEIDASDGGCCRITDFAELADRIKELGSEGDSESLYNLLYEVKFDTYLLADSVRFTNLLRKVGYDGVIHMDVFDEGQKHYKGDRKLLEEGFSSDATIVAYRTFDHSQLKSALGNSGLYLKGAKSLGDQVEATALEAALAAREAIADASKSREFTP